MRKSDWLCAALIVAALILPVYLIWDSLQPRPIRVFDSTGALVYEGRGRCEVGWRGVVIRPEGGGRITFTGDCRVEVSK